MDVLSLPIIEKNKKEQHNYIIRIVVNAKKEKYRVVTPNSREIQPRLVCRGKFPWVRDV